ncbi:MAG: DUF1800 domain-containing protein [Planctomycetota bacterium]|jgi:hypothetical protein
MFAESQSERKPHDPDWAWAPYRPGAERPWDLRLAGHLHRRAGFGADWPTLQQALSDGPQRSIEKLLHPEGDQLGAFGRTYDEYEASAAGGAGAAGLRAWWLRRMILTPHPLLEKMTLFWHGYFAISNGRVNSARLMHRHVQLLRSQALGDFAALLESVSRDPAMLLALDAAANRRAQPNENYARGLLAQFSLGQGNFSEKDVREAARAFTGWFVFRNQLRYVPREHDAGEKAILGREGTFEGDDVVRIVLQEPATPRLLVRKLYRWLISETEEPDDALIVPLAETFARDYNVARLTETMLRSNLFFSPAAYRRRIKSPVEFALGVIRGMEAMVPTTQLGGDLAGLGQDLYHPPTVKGWPGGRSWINQATLIGRSNLAAALLSGGEPYGGKLDPETAARKHGSADPASAARFLLDLFLQGDVDENVANRILKGVESSSGEPGMRLRRLAHAVVTLPEFQLS